MEIRVLRYFLTVVREESITKAGSSGGLAFHIGEAKKNGVSKEEMVEILTHAAFYAGWPKAWAAFRMAKDVYQD